jgi:hypothetical protein
MEKVVLKRFGAPDERREFEKGSFELLRVGPMTLGRARYEPGWRWSEHVGPGARASSCAVEHVGFVISGRAVVRMDDSGQETVLEPGDVFHVPPGHDSWVLGDAPYVSLHLMGAESYGRRGRGRSRPRKKATAHRPARRRPPRRPRARRASRPRKKR